MNKKNEISGITVFGQIAIDHVVDVNQILNLGPASEILTIGEDKELIFRKGSYIATEEAYIPWFFGPLSTYQPSLKYWVDGVERFGGRIMEIIQQGLVRQLGIPDKKLGGGGPNNIKLLHQVFRNFPIQFIGTYRRRTQEEHEEDIYEYALKFMVDKLDLVPLHDYPPINICFEGVGDGDRTIIRSPFPSLPLQRLEDIQWPKSIGSTVVVNTIYTLTLAVEALITATVNSKLAIIALTQALCSKNPFSSDENRYFQMKYPEVNFVNINSVHELILKYVIPNSRAVLILNEGELQHLTGIPVMDKRGRRYLGGVLDGLKEIRKAQSDGKEKIFFTMGREGSLCCFDGNGELHYCGISDTQGPIMGKTAIGDVYAGTILGYEHVKRMIQKEEPIIAHQITAATAAADVGVAKGIRAVNVLGIDGGIIESWKKYTRLGPLDAVEEKAKKLYGEVNNVRLEDVDWDKLTVLSQAESKLTGPTLLEDDIGRKWLRPPFANSIAGPEKEYVYETL